MEFKYVLFEKFGLPQDVLRVSDRTLVPPAKEEVLVRMIARPINPSDLIPVQGAYSHRIALPAVPGYEGVGIVVDAGHGVSRELIGQHVLPLRGEGTWQEYVKAPAPYVIPVPSTLDCDVAAQLYINPLTAWITCTQILNLQPGDTVLVNAGGSSIGRLYAQLAKVLGFQLIAVVRNDTYTTELLKLGASAVLNTSTTDLRVAVKELTEGRGAGFAIDSIGGQAASELALALHLGGILLSLGLLSGVPVDWAQIKQSTSVNGQLFHLRHWNGQASVQVWQQAFQDLIAMVSKQQLQLMVPSARYELSDVQEAVRMAQSDRRNQGKILLT